MKNTSPKEIRTLSTEPERQKKDPESITPNKHSDSFLPSRQHMHELFFLFLKNAKKREIMIENEQTFCQQGQDLPAGRIFFFAQAQNLMSATNGLTSPNKKITSNE